MNKLRSARPLSAVNDGGKCSDGTNEGAAVEVDDDDDLSDKGGAVYTYQIAPCAHSPQSSPYKYSPRGGESEISPRVVSSAPTSRERRILVEEEEVFFPPTIAVALVESVLGASTSDGKDGAEEDYYVVEVDSDEE